MQAAGELLESAQYLEYRYGTPKGWLEAQRRQGTDIVLEIDVQGAMQVRRLSPEAILIFVVPPTWEALAERLSKRQTETAADLEKRLAAARRELQALGEYDYVIVNDDLERASRVLESIITAERARPGRTDLSALESEDAHAA
jgi:guanylate kinase